MALQVSSLTETCNAIARQVKDRFKNLTVHYIIHNEGRRAEAWGLAGHDLLYHPASETALHLLTQTRHDEGSALIGVAVARHNMLMGLASRDSLLALCSLNADRYDSLKEARRHAYHLAWHAIDALDYHSDPEHRSGGPREVIIRKRNMLEMSDANMQADVFAAVMSVMQGDRETTKKLALARGLATLQARPSHNPECYPYVIAAETTGTALDALKNKPVAKRKYIDAALKVAQQVSRTFDESSLRQWLAFTDPAQEMAWRGHNAAQILSAAINTSDDTYVRSTGYLVSEVIGVQPGPLGDIDHVYSPFADDSFNEKLHDKAIGQTFEDIIAEGLRLNSADPFLEAANQQNQKLLDGHVLGWCAAALQASGRAFSLALESGRGAEDAARREFEGERDKTPWSGLRDLGKKIIGSYREGQPVTLASIAENAGKDKGSMAALRKSIDATLKAQGPQNAPAAAPQTMPKPAAPAMAYAGPSRMPAMASGMGPAGGRMGGMNGGVRTINPVIIQNTDQTKTTEDKTGQQ